LYDERITRFFEMRGETFRADDFFTRESFSPPVEAPAPAPAAEPVALSVDPAEPPAEVEVLDLDALPAASKEPASTPEPLPIHVTKPAMPGPGAYTFRRSTREQFFGNPPPPAALTKGQPVPPARTAAVRPIAPVVVQRQVVVGAGSPTAASARKPTTPVRRRPVSGGPYVVKEGSHADIVGSAPSRKTDPNRLPMAPISDTEHAPRTATADPRRQSQEGAPSTFVTDQSLDDVILAYLSQGERKS
jgi:hypothetical protein